MTKNPYRWQRQDPEHILPRDSLLSKIEVDLTRGVAVKLVGGRGMGKSVVLRQLEQRLGARPSTKVVRVPSPPEDASLVGFVEDLARRLNLEINHRSLDAIMEGIDAEGIDQVIVLLDEIDQYVHIDGHLARTWLNKLEATRKEHAGRLGILIAGGLGVLHLGHVLGSGLLSRAETALALPFDLDELESLAAPLQTQDRGLDPTELQTLAVLSGGNPALATFGLEQVWASTEPPTRVLERTFAEFPRRYPDFVRAVHDGVSHQGLLKAPGKVWRTIKDHAGEVPLATLREACSGDDPPVDVPQATQLLEAAGLIRLLGPPHNDPVRVHAVASILNLGDPIDGAEEPIERLLVHTEQFLSQLHRFGRDFHGEAGLLKEAVFSSLLAVALPMAGWTQTDRELVQVAGFVDLRVQLSPFGGTGHVLFEMKIWDRKVGEAEQQLFDYWRDDTRHGVVVVFGSQRDGEAWKQKYRAKYLSSDEVAVSELPSAPNLAARWRVEHRNVGGGTRTVDHCLVQLLKRS